MKDIYAWAAIGLIILASTTGDVLLSYSMKRVGDVGELWKRRGVLAVVGRVFATPTFALGLMAMGVAFYSLLFGLSWGNLSLVVPAPVPNFLPTSLHLRSSPQDETARSISPLGVFLSPCACGTTPHPSRGGPI